MKQNEELAKEALLIALSEKGQKEMTGANDGPFVWMVQEFVGGKGERGEPWCACFRSYCMGKAAEKLGTTPVTPKTDSSSSIFSFARKNNLLMAPAPGCTGLIKGNGGTQGKTHHHTFTVILVDEKQGIVHSIDGNWGNAVATTTHRIQDCDFVACV